MSQQPDAEMDDQVSLTRAARVVCSIERVCLPMASSQPHNGEIRNLFCDLRNELTKVDRNTVKVFLAFKEDLRLDSAAAVLDEVDRIVGYFFREDSFRKTDPTYAVAQLLFSLGRLRSRVSPQESHED